jgi:hypothetical protein
VVGVKSPHAPDRLLVLKNKNTAIADLPDLVFAFIGIRSNIVGPLVGELCT